MNNSLQRFSNHVDDYIKYRPHYPAEIISFLTEQGYLSKQSVVADIGSGTGIITELFLNNGNKVFAVEPNKEMREAAEHLLGRNKNFTSIAPTAEDTTLPNKSIDIIVAAQAFHWFDKEKCKTEFKRISKENGIVALIWNDRRLDTTVFLKEYEALLKKFGTDYEKVNHRNIGPEQLNTFFGAGNYKVKSFENNQYFDYEGIKGRLLSSSYIPAPGQPGFEPMLDSLKEIFDKCNVKGKITVEYDTRVYFGNLH